jgi:hypothetical protein
MKRSSPQCRCFNTTTHDRPGKNCVTGCCIMDTKLQMRNLVKEGRRIYEIIVAVPRYNASGYKTKSIMILAGS